MIIVTGLTGFVGAAVAADLTTRGYRVRGTIRGTPASNPRLFDDSTPIVLPEIDGKTDWSAALRGAECVVHCAARTHVMHECARDTLSLYRTVNVAGTRRLAEQAAYYGVRRFVYISSVKAAAERSPPDRPLRVSDTPVPEDAYGISKLEAETELLKVGAATGLETVIIRPPLVYGPRVKGNLLRLFDAISRGFPLPLAALDNRRSMVSVANLTDLVGVCVAAPAAAGRTFFVSDGEDLSTAALARRVGAALGRPARLFPVPAAVLSILARMAGKSAEIERLVGTLQVDLTDARASLAWSPPQTIDQGLHETAVWFRISR